MASSCSSPCHLPTATEMNGGLLLVGSSKRRRSCSAGRKPYPQVGLGCPTCSLCACRLVPSLAVLCGFLLMLALSPIPLVEVSPEGEQRWQHSAGGGLLSSYHALGWLQARRSAVSATNQQQVQKPRLLGPMGPGGGLLWFPSAQCLANRSEAAADLLHSWSPLPTNTDDEPCRCRAPYMSSAYGAPHISFLHPEDGSPINSSDRYSNHSGGHLPSLSPDDQGAVRVLVRVEGSLPEASCADLVRAYVITEPVDDDSIREIRYVPTSAVGPGLHAVEFAGWGRHGIYELTVYLDWAAVYPERGCSGPEHAWCRHCWPPDATQQALLLSVGPQHVTPPAILDLRYDQRTPASTAINDEDNMRLDEDVPEFSLSPPVNQQEPPSPCADLPSMMHGRWTPLKTSCHSDEESSSVDYHPLARYYIDAVQSRLPIDHYDVFWQPYTCLLPVYSPEQVRAALSGQRLHFMGDSTMHELMRHVMAYAQAGQPERVPLWPGCTGRDNRYFPPWTSPSLNVTFSFSWLGGPDPCDNSLGLGAVLADVKAHRRIHEEAGQDDGASTPPVSMVVINTGLHDLPLPPHPPFMSMRQYRANLQELLDIVIGQWGLPPGRVVLKTTTPLLGSMTCPDGEQANRQQQESRRSTRGTEEEGQSQQQAAANNGAISWMNWQAHEVVEEMGGAVPVMEVFGLIHAEQVLLKGEMRDGSHCHGRASCSYQAIILLHHIINTLSNQEN